MTPHLSHVRKQQQARKPRAELARAAHRVIESLENRLLLSVSLNAAGWTVVTPTSGVSRLIYVSSSTGSDTNNGLSPSSPVATIAHAVSMLRNNEPDWVLFMRGDTFSGSISLGVSGMDAQDPIVFTSYGDSTLPRPVIDAGTNTAFRTGSGYIHDFDVIGLTFTTSTKNPSSPNYTGQGSYGFYDLGNNSDVLIEDCSFSYFINDITFQGYYGGLINITVRRNEILDSYSTNGHSQGLYADTCTNLTIYDNVFDHDGWNADVPGAGPTIYNHDCYLHSSNVNCVVTDNVFAEAGSFGLQARAGGIVDDNLFIEDPYGFSFGLVNGATTKAGGCTGEAIGNVVLDPRSDPAGWGIGAMIGNLKVGGGTVISDNIFAGDPNGDTPALDFQPGNAVSNPQQEAGLNTVTISNNTAYDWGFGLLMSSEYVPGTVGANGLTAVVIKDNNFQDNVTGRIVSHGDLYDPRYEDWSGNTYSSTTANPSSWFSLQGPVIPFATWKADVEPTALMETVPFLDPTQSVSTYMASQGMTASEAAFIAGARAQSETNWNPIYEAAAVNSYIQGGFIVDTNPPMATVTPPPDVTPDNYLTTPSPTFTVTYTDDVAVNPATIASSNITVDGAGGVTLPVSLVSTSGSGASIAATYEVSALNGDWTTVPDGTYVISLAGGQVADTSGNTIAAEPLGTFNVTVNGPDPIPLAAATTPINFSAIAGTSNITVSWSDPAGDQSSYILQRAFDSNFTQDVQNYPLTSDATSYVDPSVVVGDTYYYQLIATNSIGPSAPTAAASAVILPLPPVLSRVFLDDGNAARAAITSATLVFSSSVTVTPAMISLVQNPTGSATPVTTMVSNPTGDGKTWIVSWGTNAYNNALPDGAYSLTVHGGLIADAYGQTAGGDSTTKFTSAVAPTVTNVVYYHTAPPHSLSFTFSQDVSASLAANWTTALKLSSTTSVIPAASYSWNPTTLTATWTYSGALADGNYSAHLYASLITNANGDHLDGAGQGVPNNDYVYNFTQVKPTATASGNANVNVNAPYALTLGAITDAGETSPQYLVHWGDGSTSTYSAAGVVTHTYTTALGPTKITVDVLDANGTHAGVASVSVSVNRATIALTGNANANPAAAYTLNLGAVTDPGFTVSQYIVHWGNGSSSTYTTAGAKTHTFTNTTSSTVADTITVDLVDNGGTGGASFTNVTAGTLNLTINSYPYVPLSGTLNANAGGNYRLILAAPTDNGFTVSQLVINWGDGSPSTTVAPGTTLVNHTFNTVTAPNTDEITVDLTDNSGTYKTAGHEYITINPPPTVALSGTATANVGGTYVLNVATAVDIGQRVSQYTINWNDGSPATTSGGPGNFNHIFTSTGPATITVDLTDGNGVFTAAGSLPITVNNDPTIALSGDPYANAGGTYTLNLGAVNDPGQTVSQYTVNWGDGTAASVYTSAGAVTHTYASPGADTISVGLTDGTGTYSGAGTLPVSIAQPTVSLSGNSGVFQGQSYALMINPATDLGGMPQEYVVNWGDGTSSSYMNSGTVSHIFAQHVYSVVQHAIVTVDLTDNTGTFLNAGSLPLTIAPPPTVNLQGAANTNVGGLYTLNLAGAVDPIGTISSYIVHWGDTTTSTASTLGSLTHTYSAAGPQSISVDIVDQNGTYAGAANLALAVNQPSIPLSGNSIAALGQPYTLTLGNVFDPGQSVSSYTIHWGDGNSSTVTATGPVQHKYSVGGNQNISVDLTDGIGTFSAVGTLAVNVLSNIPTLTLSGSANANAGGLYTLTMSNLNDVNGTPSEYAVHWGDGNISDYTSLGAVTHPYTTLGLQNISVDVIDSANTWIGVATTTVTVHPAPTIALSGNANANTGGTYSLTLGSVSDPGYAVSQYTVNWGDGDSSSYSTAGIITHPYTNAGPANITVALTDPTGTFTSAGSKSITVNPAPTIALSGNANANTGGIYSLTLGAVTDPGYTVSQYTVHWGDGKSSVSTTGGALTHTYAAAGAENITVDLTDSTGTFTSAASKSITVNPAPTIAVSGAATATVGSAYSLTLGAVTDSGYTVSQYTVHWGDGTSSTYSAGGVVSHTYTSAVAAAITLDLTDAGGTYTKAGALNVTVAAAASTSLFNSNIDIGAPKFAGSASLSNGTYTVTGEGADIWGPSDQFHYYSKTVTGNTTVSATVKTVSNTNVWAKAGVMIRNGTAANAAFADVVVTPGGYLAFEYRTKAGGACTNVNITGKAPAQSVKLTRSGNTFTAWYLSGTTWKQIGSAVTIVMSSTVNTGLAVTSLNTAKTCTATFTGVSVM